MNNLAPIHQTPEDKLAIHTERSADSLELVNEKLDILNETIKKAERAKSEPINVNIKLELI